MRFDREMNEIYKRNALEAGRTFPELSPMMARMAASTDMGNVSHAIPSIHPAIGINSLPAGNHQPEFTAHCITPDADRAVGEGALAMAWTAIEMAQTASVRQRLIGRLLK
jgi:metal-dependent amidase/aminoacylase/carboxypeptidase family protein